MRDRRTSFSKDEQRNKQRDHETDQQFHHSLLGRGLAGWLDVTWLAGGEAGTAFLHLARLATGDDRLEKRASKLVAQSLHRHCEVNAELLRGYCSNTAAICTWQFPLT